MPSPHLQSVLPPTANAFPQDGKTQTAAGCRILLLADDLTGACDASVGFVHQGFTAAVLLKTEAAEQLPAEDLLAVVTDTRALEPEAARERVLAQSQLRNCNGLNIFHKIDSAGRGNPGMELEALAQQTGCEAIVFTPAFPTAGRTVRDGRLFVSDFSGQAKVVELAELIPAPLRDRIAHIPAGPAATVQAAMVEHCSAGRNLWICDAASEADLAVLVEAASGTKLRLLWSGAAGLAAAVAGHLAREGRIKPACTPLPHPEGRTLVISGTDHPVTMAQMEELDSHAVALQLDAPELPAFDCGRVQMDWAQVSPESVRAFWRHLHKADPRPIAVLVLTGGDTAAFVLEALGARALLLGGELERGIPWSRVQGGMAEGSLVVTKSGGFGSPMSLRQCAEFSQRMVG